MKKFPFELQEVISIKYMHMQAHVTTTEGMLKRVNPRQWRGLIPLPQVFEASGKTVQYLMGHPLRNF